MRPDHASPMPASTPRSPDSSTQAPASRAGAVLRSISTSGSWLLALGLIAGAALGFDTLRSSAAAERTAESADRANTPRFVVHWPPMPETVVAEARRQGYTGPVTWLDRDSRSEIETIVRTLATSDPFDHESLATIQRGLMSTGWFAEPVRVARQRDGSIDVRGVWRVPAAAVRTNNADRLVTRSGRLLSPKYLNDRSGLKVVLGASAEPPQLGESWPVGDVQPGLELLEYLRAMPGYEQVYAVDVSEFLSKGSLVVVTTTGTRVLWGGRIGEFHPGQAPDQTKRLRLAELFVRFGRIDAGQALIDLRTEDGPYVVLGGGDAADDARADMR